VNLDHPSPFHRSEFPPLIYPRLPNSHRPLAGVLPTH